MYYVEYEIYIFLAIEIKLIQKSDIMLYHAI